MPDAPAKPSRGVWKAVLLLLVVFVLGAASGIGGGLLFLRSQIRRAATAPVTNRGPLDTLADRMESRLTGRLQLSESERSAVREELAASVRQAKEIRLRIANDIRALAGDTVARIAKHLSAEKQVKLWKEAESRLEPWGLNVKPSGTPPTGAN